MPKTRSVSILLSGALTPLARPDLASIPFSSLTSVLRELKTSCSIDDRFRALDFRIFGRRRESCSTLRVTPLAFATLDPSSKIASIRLRKPST